MITIAGIEKVLPRFQDLEVMLQVLARSATGERMNPYTSVWTGVTAGDGPQKFHVVLLDNGRSSILAKKTERQTLRCIRCAACMNGCPVYRQTGGHAYGSVYPGPIGAVLSPQLTGMRPGDVNATLPFASTLCGACLDACPVAIDIPTMLVYLRAEAVAAKTDAHRFPTPEAAVMAMSAWTMRDPRRWRRALRVLRLGRVLGRRSGRIRRLPPPLAAWTRGRDLPRPPRQSLRDWWADGADHD
jgi:L-lactate dehydrogenase complex protein LldF